MEANAAAIVSPTNNQDQGEHGRCIRQVGDIVKCDTPVLGDCQTLRLQKSMFRAFADMNRPCRYELVALLHPILGCARIRCRVGGNVSSDSVSLESECLLDKESFSKQTVETTS
jgi:hypothetical protein